MIIDFHAHIQPKADHGCNSLEMSERQLLLAKQAGVDCVVAVSHFYPFQEDIDSYWARTSKARDDLANLVSNNPDLPHVMFGTEVTLCNCLDKMEGLKKLCIKDTNCILIEMPFKKWDPKLIETLDNIKYDLGLSPVLAHVDRYNPQEIEKLFEMDIPGQINFYSLLRFFGRKKLLNWIKNGNIVAWGSDIHQLAPGYKGLSKALKLVGEQQLNAITEKSKALLNL